MAHQLEGVRRSAGKRYFAYFMEQGTGKSWTLLADAERHYAMGKINALFILAPNGVHTNWVLREIDKHLDCPNIKRAWRAGMSKSKRAKMDDLMTWRAKGAAEPLRILTMAWESIQSKDAFEFALSFMQSTRCMFAWDESQYGKNGKAERTKHAMRLRPHSVARRLLSGSPFDKPWDIFSQAEFLEEGLLGTSSFRAFCSEYAVLADWKNPVTDSDWAMKKQVAKNPRMAHAIIVAKDDTTGLPMYRNLDKLNKLIEPWSYRVLKKDCLDLPEKIYQQVFFDLSTKQRAAYQLMEDEFRIRLEDGSVTPVSALASLVKLQQITSGYVVVPGREDLLYVDEKNPRLEALMTSVEPFAGRKKFIVWARFREEIAAIAARLRKEGLRVVEYHGGISAKDREAAIDELQEGAADAIVMNQQAGGTGLTLTAAAYAIYYSNYYSLLRRIQSEDRNHRIGTEKFAKDGVVYIDLIAEDTIDSGIALALQQKADLAATILGDRKLNLPAGLDE
jgi:SNF2 family DNA or RNA helicase